MPFTSGTYSLPSGNPVVTGTTISSSTTNTTNSDIATALSSCILKDGTQTITANLPMASHKLTGLSAGTTAGDSVEYAGSPSFTNLAYTGTLTGSTGILNIGSGQVYKDASGNVGIGTSSPATYGKLVVKQTADTSISSLALVAQASTTDSQLGIGYDSASGTFRLTSSYFSTGVFKPISFWTSDVERMRIDDSGNLLVGTTSTAPRDFTSGTASKIPGPGNPVEFAIPDSNCMFLNYTGSASGSATLVTFRQQGINRGTIATNGSTTSYNTTSDYRLKDNISPMVGALDKVVQLKPVTYTWKQNGSNGQGFIAHELQAVVPDCVVGEKDAVDKDGKPQYQGIDTSFLVATLTAAIQEQQTLIEALTARLTKAGL